MERLKKGFSANLKSSVLIVQTHKKKSCVSVIREIPGEDLLELMETRVHDCFLKVI